MISVIIPVYNEEKTIAQLLDGLCSCKDLEAIVVDGQSSDKTQKVIEQYQVKALSSEKMRAKQCNVGANQAKGDIFVFLHADCLPDRESFKEIRASIDKGFIGGCLRQSIEDDRKVYRFIEASGNLRAKIFKIFYGDQAIFVKRDFFFKIGGFDEVEIFEDVLFSKKLKREGKTSLLNKKVYTLPRRWINQGLIKVTFINWFLTLGLFLGFSPKTLKKLYLDIR
tara:strand:- start:424 stop:1095 length:672 start_codon:yes stop_codon:yes gene_type:complete